MLLGGRKQQKKIQKLFRRREKWKKIHREGGVKKDL